VAFDIWKAAGRLGGAGGAKVEGVSEFQGGQDTLAAGLAHQAMVTMVWTICSNNATD
jgi:hypothetical protein